MDGMILVLMPFLMFVPFFVFLLVVAQQKRDCPDCGRPLSWSQSPSEKTWRMWVEGGFLCRNCGCETTLSGEKVAPGTGPRTRSLVLGGSILALTVAVGAVTVFLLLNPRTPAPAVIAAPALGAPQDIAAPPPLVAPLDVPPRL